MSANTSYFKALSLTLKELDVFQPTLILDLDRLDKNIAVLLSDLPEGMDFRVVAKSLPIPKLLDYICAATGTHKMMTFNYPMLSAIAKSNPERDQLLGKPLPVSALRAFLKTSGANGAKNIHWLIDTPERLTAYIDAAKDYGDPLNIVLELDIGLHRGGFSPDKILANALTRLRENEYVKFQGFMGYEPYLISVPKAFGWQKRAIQKAWGKYEAALKMAQWEFGEDVMADIIRNAAGSPTYRLYKDTKISNEVSIGSALVKPKDFDIPILEPFLPACFIAAPVLKATGKTRIPALEFIDPVKRLKSPSSAQSFFIHGGKWMAAPHYPPNLSYNKTFGRSSNQEMINAPAAMALTPGDFIFFRPHQSEAILMQFGEVIILRGAEFLERWPAFAIST